MFFWFPSFFRYTNFQAAWVCLRKSNRSWFRWRRCEGWEWWFVGGIGSEAGQKSEKDSLNFQSNGIYDISGKSRFWSIVTHINLPIMICHVLWEIHCEWGIHRWEMIREEFMETTFGPSPRRVADRLSLKMGWKLQDDPFLMGWFFSGAVLNIWRRRGLFHEDWYFPFSCSGFTLKN